MESAPMLAAAPVMVTPAPTQVQDTPTPVPKHTAASADDMALGATYTDPELGFAFDYPASWGVGRREQQSRGGFVQLIGSEGDLDDVRMQLTVLNWDPKQDLEAFLEVRRTAWESSGTEIQNENDWTWSGGVPGKTFRLQGVDGALSQVHFTYLEDRYLEISTTSEYQALEAIIATLRFEDD